MGGIDLCMCLYVLERGNLKKKKRKEDSIRAIGIHLFLTEIYWISRISQNALNRRWSVDYQVILMRDLPSGQKWVALQNGCRITLVSITFQQNLTLGERIKSLSLSLFHYPDIFHYVPRKKWSFLITCTGPKIVLILE